MAGPSGRTLACLRRREIEVRIQDVVAQMERLSGEYEVGGLQSLRVQLRQLSRPGTYSLFGRGVSDEGYAYHSGGRDELQFNVGFEPHAAGERIRAGVAFSFEPSRSLPDVSVLRPLAKRFNDFIELNADSFLGAMMWHYQNERRSADYRPTVIQEELLQPATFIFLGMSRPLEAFDPRWALAAFDRFVSMYRFVMTASETVPTLEPPRPFVFTPQRIMDGPRATMATTEAQSFNVDLRHRGLQAQLCDYLARKLGPENVAEEASIGGFRADVITRENGELVIYEVKTCGTARACLREAMGQLLDYGFWPQSIRPIRLVVCGEPALDADGVAFPALLNASFPAKLEYRAITLSN